MIPYDKEKAIKALKEFPWFNCEDFAKAGMSVSGRQLGAARNSAILELYADKRTVSAFLTSQDKQSKAYLEAAETERDIYSSRKERDEWYGVSFR